ncbi:MAG TPA: hypothetical protein VLT36_19020, partial [Candidatus Dormibacteraeota bacterium]|nr:hypothetical protein [Candidatus Dormibacteraeota bacterium]
STAGWHYENWDLSFGAISWASGQDAQGSASSGAMQVSTSFDPIRANNGYGGAYRFPIGDLNASAYTALEYDVKVDPASAVDQYGNAADFKVGLFTTSSYNYHANDLNVFVVSTNNGWRHVVIPASSLGATEWNDVKEVFIQEYDNNYTNHGTNIIYIDNIKFTGPDPTYPNYTGFKFDNADFMNGVVTNWYGWPVSIEWATNDAAGSPSSGSLHMVATYAPNDNCFVAAIPFDTNFVHDFSTADTNYINGRNYQAVEMDILWDTNNSDVDLSEFNAKGDVGGFPLGLLVNSGAGGGGQIEAFGNATTALPNAASNGWVHVRFPLNRTSPNIDQTIGLWLKKYNWGSISGQVAFFMDNVTFIGAPLEVPRPTLSISKPVRGLQCVSTGTGNNPSFDREELVTYSDTYTFVDQPDPVTYAINIGYMPPASYSGYGARIQLVSTGIGVPGTAAEPDWVYPNVLFMEIQRSGSGSSLTLHAKTNSANGNGQYYTQTNPNFTTASRPEGKWLFTFTQNTNILVKAPDGSSTNLPFPLGFSSADVEANFINAGMVAYYGGMNGGSANEGQRLVLAGAGFTNGASSFYDDFSTDTNLDINNGGGGLWLNASDTSSRTDGVYLLGASTKWFLDWTVNGGTGFLVQTNGNLANPGAWATNAISTTAVLIADHFHADADQTNLPPAGPVFFRMAKPAAP